MKKSIRLRLSLVLFAMIVVVGASLLPRVWADYVGSLTNRIFVDPASISVIADGYQNGDVVSFILETTPADTGSDQGHAAWMTLYVPAGVEVVGAEFAEALDDGSYESASAVDTDDTYNGWGVRGAKLYTPSSGTVQLGEGFVNEVQQDTGIFYSTDPQTILLVTPLSGLAPTGLKKAADPTPPIYNLWDYNQTEAFGIDPSLSANLGKGNTPLISTDSGVTWAGTGSMVAGSDVYYTNHYDPDCSVGINFEDDIQCVGPWQRIQTDNAKFGGSGPVTPATQAGLVEFTAVADTSGHVLSQSNPLPAGTNTVRFVHGKRRLGELETSRVTLRITDAAAFISSLADDTFCIDSTGGDTSDIAGKDNPWRYYEPAHQCSTFSSNANLFKQSLYVNGSGGTGSSLSVDDVIGYEITYTNTSGGTLTNVAMTDAPADTSLLRLVVDPTDGSDPATAFCPYTSYDGTPSGPTYDLASSSTSSAVWQTVASLAAGASFTVRLCAEVIAGVKGDRIENIASVTYSLPDTSSETLNSNTVGTISALISGHVYDDKDASGGQSSGDTPISGVTISLYQDNNGDGALSAGDTFVESTTSLTDGRYEFSGILPAAYLVVETDPSGFASISDADTPAGFCHTGNGCTTIGTLTITDTESYTGQDFYDVGPGFVNTISGTVYVDVNSNQAYEPGLGEQGEPSVTVKLYQDENGDGAVDAGDTFLQSQLTDSSGEYEFVLAALDGDFVMEVDTSTLPAGSSMTTDNVEVATFTGYGQSETDNEFGFIEPAAFSVTKTSDAGGPVDAGQVVTYTIGVTNTSSLGQFGIRVTDPLPAGANYFPESTTVTGFVPIATSAFDDFASQDYSGGTGWCSGCDWTEIGDDGQPDGGDIQIKEDKKTERSDLKIKKQDKGVQRDLDLLNCVDATLSFAYRRNKTDSDDALTVDIVGEEVITTINGGSNEKTFLSVSYPISDSSLSATMTLRFLTNSTTTGEFFINSVLVEATCPQAATKENAAAAPDPLTDGDTPDLAVVADDFFLPPGQPMSVTFKVYLDNPLPPGTTQIVNIASVKSSVNPVPASDTATDNVDLLTLATISSFGAFDNGGQVVVKWETTSEAGTVGFYVYRYDWQRGTWLQVNPNLVPGLFHSPQGGAYSLHDTGAPAGRRLTYALVEMETQGNLRVHGPYDVEVRAEALTQAEPKQRRERRPQKRMLERLLNSKKTKGAAPPTRGNRRRRGKQRAPQAAAAKITVRDRGLYYLDAPRIAGVLGLTPEEAQRRIQKKELSLENQGKPVAWLPAPADGGIYFYGEPIDSIYTNENIYWLRARKGLQMDKLSAETVTVGSGSEWFTETLHLEQDKFAGVVIPTDPDGDFWYWDYVIAGDRTYGSRSFSVNPEGLAHGGSGARLTVHLQGASSTGVLDEHHVLVSVNGYAVGEMHWEGMERHQASFTMPTGYLFDGENTIELTGFLNPGVAYSYYYVDAFDLEYPRQYDAAGATFFFNSEDHPVISLDGFTDPTVTLFDLADPFRPRLMEGVKVDAVAGGYRVSFAPQTRSARHLAVTRAGVKTPPSMKTDTDSNLRSKSNTADYLVIAPGELLEAARALADYRKTQGLKTMVVDQEDVRDEFSHGISTPYAIRSFLQHTVTTWRGAPRYVVLAGKGNFDYKDIMGLGGNLVPPLMVRTDHGLFASDNRLADVIGDDGAPDIAIGRLPVVSSEELLQYLGKIRAYETASVGPWTSRVLMLADNPDRGANFPAESDRLLSLLPAGYQPERIYLSELSVGDARERLWQSWMSGVSHVHYIGHGGLDRLAEEALLSSADVPALDNGNRLPIVTTMTCTVGRFAVPGFAPLAEELLQKTDGGAIAVWAPTGLSKNGQAAILGEHFFIAAFQNRQTLGGAIVSALHELAKRGASRTMLEVYQLFGDPALRSLGPSTLP